MSSGHGSGGHGRRRPKRHEEEEHENHERWAVSYADMMTVLVGLFIVLFAVSQVDQVKYEQLRQSLAVGFGNDAPSMIPGGSGVLPQADAIEITPDLAAQTGIEDQQLANPAVAAGGTAPDQLTLDQAAAEYGRLSDIAGRISDALADQGLADRVRFRMTDRGLVVGMVADDVFFAADAATLTDTARRVLDTVAPVLAGVHDEISVEGHANVVPTSRYPTNWELSSDRATQVLRRLVENGAVPATRIAAVGFGDARPLEEAGGAAALEANRRVDLVVLSPAPDQVRALLPTFATQR